MKKRNVMLFESWDRSNMFDLLLENVSGEIKSVQKDVDEIMKDLKDEGKDADTDEVKAAILMQAIDLVDQGKDVEDVDVAQAKNDVKEGMSIRGKSFNELFESGDINESAGGLIHGIEIVGNIMGNAALMEYITRQIKKLTGKDVDMSKVSGTIQKVIVTINKATGLPAKALGKFLSWIAGKLGFEGAEQKGVKLIAKLAVIVFLFALGIVHFPVLGVGTLWWVLSITGLIGKGIEILEIGKHIYDLIVKALKDDKAKEEIGIGGEELANLAEAK